MTMILNRADGLVATNARFTDIHTSVGESVAVLVSRAVVIFQTVDLLASGESIRLAGEKSRRTCTFGNMIPGCTDGTRSTL